jgi:hypothetical protein
VTDFSWAHDARVVSFNELSELYRIAPLGDKPPDALATVFGNSMFVCFVYPGRGSQRAHWQRSSRGPVRWFV